MSRVKVFAADDHEALLADVGNLVTVVDSQRAIKSASSSKITRALLEKWAPDKDHFLMHVVAMGDDEHYGCNRNCFPAGTPVRTPSGFRAIETLNNGDLVLTAAKTYKPVTHLFRREFCGTQVSITAWNLAKPVVCTAEHPLQVLRKEHTVVGRLNPKVNGRRQGVERIAANFELATANAEFVEASNVCPGDWLRVPSEHGTGATLSWDPWMLGLYVADGCLAKEYKDISTKGEYKTLLFTLGSHDDAGVIPRLLSCLGDLGRKTSVQPSDTSEHGRRIAVGHKELAEFCLATFGAQALTKTIGAAVFSQSVEWKLNFLAGLFDGDGCSGADDSISLSTASFDLASCVQRLLASCGIVSSVTCGFNDSDKGCFGRGRLPIYAVLVGAGRSNAIKSRSARFVPHAKDCVLCSKARIANGDLWVLVDKVLPEETTCPVFNIEVADEHTYVTTVAGHNCDAWSSDELDKTHGTFVTHAHFYREHENRRKNQRIGSVKDSVFNREMGRVELLVHGRLRPAPGEPLTAEPEYERARQGKNVDVSMSCFPGFTRVTMSDGTRKRIEDIVPGEWVLTKEGTPGLVTHSMSRDYAESAVTIAVCGLADTLTATMDHPIWARPKKWKRGVDGVWAGVCPVCGEVHRSLAAHVWQKKDERHQALFVDRSRALEGWRNAEDLAVGDWVCTPFHTEELDTDATPAYASLLGWYIAEGSAFLNPDYTATHHCVDFTVGAHEPFYAEEIKTLLTLCGCPDEKLSVYVEPEQGRIRVRVRHMPLVLRLHADGGRLAGGKTLSMSVRSWPLRLQKLLLEAWLEGDGSFGAPHWNFTGVTVSESLARQLAEICWRLSIPARLYRRTAQKTGDLIKDRIVRSRQASYALVIPEVHAGKLNTRKNAGHALVPLKPRSLKHLKNQKDRTSVPGYRKGEPVVVEPGKVWRKITKISKALLTAPVYDLTVDTAHSFVAEDIGVSNCSIHGDYCTACNHFAPTQDQYCGCFKKYRGRWSPEHQRKVYVLNKVKHFFDISSVKDRADHIARFLEYRFNDGSGFTRKAASLVLPTGYDVAEAYGMKDDHTYGLSTYAGLRRLSDMLTPAGVKAASIMFDDAQLTKAEADVFRAARKPALMLKMARAGVVLPFHSFVTVFSNLDHNAAAEDPVVKRAFALLPSALRDFDGLEPLADMEPVFEAGSAAAENNGTDDVDGLMSAVAERLGMKPQPAATMNVTIIKLAALDLALPPEREQGAVKLAQAYTIYKAASLNNMERVHGRLSDYEVRVVASRF